jgi:phosphate starvation-inducible protein PhoH and related proteins
MSEGMTQSVEFGSRETPSRAGVIGLNSTPGAAAAVQSHDVDLPPRHVELLFSGSDAPARHIELAVRPYRLQVVERPRGARFTGDELAVMLAERMIERIGAAMRSTGRLDEALINDTVGAVIQAALKRDLAFRLTGLRQSLRPVSLSQVAFMNAILHADRALIFGIGPTGTGKTHLAIAAGLSLVAESRFKSMIITRPHVMMDGEIMTPELRAETATDEQFIPIQDVLRDLIGREEMRRLSDQGLIEVMPLGRMRGRTFNESFIVVDEAQNMTVRRMRMAVTRLGRASRMLVTGDPDQHDLPDGEISGLSHLLRLVAATDIALVHRFENQEIIRNDLVARIEALYAESEGEERRRALA